MVEMCIINSMQSRLARSKLMRWYECVFVRECEKLVLYSVLIFRDRIVCSKDVLMSAGGRD